MSEQSHFLLSKRIPNFGISLLLGVALAINMAAPHVYAAAPSVTEYALPASSDPAGMAVGPDGNMWFVENNGERIGKITPTGVVTAYDIDLTNGTPGPAGPIDITDGPDGNMWFTEFDGNAIGKITPSGVITEYSLPTAASQPAGITTGPDGKMWFVEKANGKIGNIDTGTGTILEPNTTPGGAGSGLNDIATGPDGNLWFTEAGVSKIGLIDLAFPLNIAEYPTTTAGASPTRITTGADGKMWFTEASADKIGSIDPANPPATMTEYGANITASSSPNGITVGPDGNVWFTEGVTGKIGKITSSGSVTEYDVSASVGAMGAIEMGPDGNLWFADQGADKIGRLNLIPTVTNSDGTTTTTIAAGDNFSNFDYIVADKQTLIVDGTVGNVTIQSGGTLKGHGTVGNVTVESGGHLAPGNSPGCINTGNLTMNSGSFLDEELGGTAACSQYDQTKVTGTVSLVNATLNTSLVNGFVPAVGNSFTVIDNDGSDAVTGTFNGLAEGATFTANGVTYKVSYVGGTGNDVVLTVTAVAPGAGSAAAPAAPNTGLGLVAAHPVGALAASTIAALALTLIARRLQPARATTRRR